MRSHFVCPRIVVLQYNTGNGRAAALPPERALSRGRMGNVCPQLSPTLRTHRIVPLGRFSALHYIGNQP